jgi:hypothetical protein
MDEIRKADVAHRQAYQQFVLLEARPWYQQHLGRLYLLWGKWNQEYFGGALVTPYFSMAMGVLNNPRLDRRFVGGDLHTAPAGCGADGQPGVGMDVLLFEVDDVGFTRSILAGEALLRIRSASPGFVLMRGELQ